MRLFFHFLYWLFLFISLQQGIAQTATLSNAEFKNDRRLMVIGHTDQGYFAFSDFSYAHLVAASTNGIPSSIAFFDNKNNLVKDYRMSELTEKSGEKNAIVKAVDIHNNELLMLCVSRPAGKMFLLKPFTGKLVEVNSFPRHTDLFGNSKCTVEMFVSEDSRMVVLYEQGESGITNFFFDENLEQVDFEGKLKEFRVGKKIIYPYYFSFGSYICVSYSDPFLPKGSALISAKSLEVMQPGAKAWETIEMGNNKEPLSIHHTADILDKKNAKIETISFQWKERGWVGYVIRTTDMRAGQVVNEEFKEYDSKERQLMSVVKAKGDFTEGYTFQLKNGSLVSVFRYGKKSQGYYGCKWGNIYIVSHNKNGDLKWVRTIEHRVKYSTEFNNKLVVFPHENSVKLIVNERGIAEYSIDEEGAVTRTSLKGKELNENSMILPESGYMLNESEIVIPCITGRKTEMLKISY